MKLTVITARASYLLLAASFAGVLVSASPVEPRGALCPAGLEYFKVKSLGRVSYGTCCGANLPGAVWKPKDDRPACSLSVLFTTPAVSVNTCPREANMAKKGDLEVCVYSPLKTKRLSPCPYHGNYLVLQVYGIDVGTCCPARFQAVWNVTKPMCSFGTYTTPADSVNNCGDGTEEFLDDGLKVCVSLPKTTKRDELYCPGGDEWFELENDGKTYGFCCRSQSVAATWDKVHGPQCCGGDKKACEGRATSVKGCPRGWHTQSLRERVAVCRKD